MVAGYRVTLVGQAYGAVPAVHVFLSSRLSGHAWSAAAGVSFAIGALEALGAVVAEGTAVSCGGGLCDGGLSDTVGSWHAALTAATVTMKGLAKLRRGTCAGILIHL